jgi:hypothetical protein
MVSHPFIRDHFHHMGRNDAKCSANSSSLTHDRVRSIRKQALRFTHTGSFPRGGGTQYHIIIHFLGATHRVDPADAGSRGGQRLGIEWSCGPLWILKWPETFDAALQMNTTPV